MGDPFLRFVFLTLPSSTEPTLNITIGQDHKRYRITRDQLFALNAQTADALSKGRIEDKNQFRVEDQLAMGF